MKVNIAVCDPNEFVLGIRFEQGEYGSLNDNMEPTGESTLGSILTFGFGLINIHLIFGFDGEREE